MEKNKFIEAVKALQHELFLQGEPLEIRVISGSMRFLLAPGDIVVIRKTAASEISRGDIIVWGSLNPQRENMVVHRVNAVRQADGSTQFVTKGDRNPRADLAPTPYADVVGKVVKIKKSRLPFAFRIDTLSGKAVSILCSRITAAVTRAQFAGRAVRDGAVNFLWRAAAFVMPLNRAAMLRAGRAGMDPHDWMDRVSLGRDMLDSLRLQPGCAIADLQFGTGFSEEAAHLLRAGTPVTGVDIFTARGQSAEQFDYVIAAGVFDMVPTRGQRAALTGAAVERLKPGGVLVMTGACGARVRAELERGLKSATRVSRGNAWACTGVVRP